MPFACSRTCRIMLQILLRQPSPSSGHCGAHGLGLAARRMVRTLARIHPHDTAVHLCSNISNRRLTPDETTLAGVDAALSSPLMPMIQSSRPAAWAWRRDSHAFLNQKACRPQVTIPILFAPPSAAMVPALQELRHNHRP